MAEDAPLQEGEGAVPVPERPGARGLARGDFEQVIRRAAELASKDSDPDEMLSQQEVLRIAQELGLPAHHVQRAIYELPELATPPRWYDRYYGTPIVSVNRVVPDAADATMRRLQDYLVTREYLQVVRRRGDSVALIPAEDALSSLARAFTRSGKRHMISRASRVLLSVQPLPDSTSHVRFELDLAEERRQAHRRTLLLGGLGGVFTGTLAAGAAAGISPAFLGPLPEVLAFGGGLLAVGAASVAASAARFKNRVFTARFELAGLLDRVEHRESLEPPPAPWRRRLQLRLFGR